MTLSVAGGCCQRLEMVMHLPDQHNVTQLLSIAMHHGSICL